MRSPVETRAAGVVVPVYNRATVILATLESIARQTVRPGRLVVVDDGSTDDTAEAVETWINVARPPFPSQLVRSPHVGAAAARNVGFATLQAVDYVAFLDSDDCWPLDFIARTTAALDRRPEAVAATVDRRYVDSLGAVYHFDDCRTLSADPINWFFHHGAGVASSTLLRADAVQRIGGWSESLRSAEDSMLFTRLALEGPWVHAPGEPVDFHFGNAAARNEEINLSARYRDSVRRWAGVYELIYEAVDSRYPRRRLGRLRDGVAAYWYRAGKQLERLGEKEEAQECFRRAIRWKPTMWRAWKRRFLAVGRR